MGKHFYGLKLFYTPNEDLSQIRFREKIDDAGLQNTKSCRAYAYPTFLQVQKGQRAKHSQPLHIEKPVSYVQIHYHVIQLQN